MNKLRKFMIATLLVALTSSVVDAQPPVYEPYETYEAGEAYSEGTSTPHWSVYIPITIMVAAVIWFGVADGKEDNDSTSHNGLGSLSSSNSSSRSRSSRSSRSSSSSSHHSH